MQDCILSYTMMELGLFEDLVNKTENDISKINGIGYKTLEELNSVMAKLGLSLQASPDKVVKKKLFINDAENIFDIKIEDIGISMRLYAALYRS